MSLVVNHNLMATKVATSLNHNYAALATSTRCLATGLRINTAADDAAGSSIRELQRTEIATLHQGMRNANDAISLIQTADSALSIIDEKLIRMKELAEQAATGTYNSVQRLMLDSEFQQMASEIDRIALATDFNGIHILNGELDGDHDGSKLTATGALKIHFGSGNDSAEDYYYINIPRATVGSLFPKSFTYLAEPQAVDPSFVDWTQNGTVDENGNYVFEVNGKISGSWAQGIDAYVIPQGLTNITITINSAPAAHQPHVNLFTTGGTQLTGYSITDPSKNSSWWNSMTPSQILSGPGFAATATYDESQLATMNNANSVYNFASGATLTNKTGISETGNFPETLELSKTPEDLVFLIGGHANGFCNRYDLKITATASPDFSNYNKITNKNDASVLDENYVQNLRIDTQDHAQQMLSNIDIAITNKDKIRANLGSLQNRFENTITNLTSQAENLQASESRISDVDVATEMTTFVRNQILTQSAVAMLSQANALPQMALQLIGS